MSAVSVRPATGDDLPAVRRLLVDTWHATYDRLYGRTKVDEITGAWHTLEVLERQLGSPGSVRLVALSEGRLVGTANATSTPDGTLSLHQLYVLPEAQRRGVGKALLEAVLAECAEATRVTLEVEPANEAAVAFYRRMGFAKVGAVSSCGRNSGIAADVYAREITRAS